VRSFTLALREEYAGSGVVVQHLAPLFVSTKINAFSQRLMAGGTLVPDAATYARHASAALARLRATTGYWLHGIQVPHPRHAPYAMRHAPRATRHVPRPALVAAQLAYSETIRWKKPDRKSISVSYVRGSNGRN
jgi:NAD(P)-dependent dehydrogenase (short-subunit alcohol dehydrogenase family)